MMTVHCCQCGKSFKVGSFKFRRNAFHYCNKICYLNRERDSVSTRFWSRVEKTDNCWLWTGALNVCGYGVFSITKDLQVRAHRYAWTATHGEIPHNLLVCHHCDNPPCVNPMHLFLGTNKENMADAKRKHRIANGVRSPTSKLSEADVRMIRLSSLSSTKLAKQFGISCSTVRRLLRNETWSHFTS
jgi:hypothetical protein